MSTPLLLAIDVGNTNTVFALYEGDRQKSQWRAVTTVERTADEYAVWLTQLMALAGIAPDRIADAIISSVVPESDFTLHSLCRRHYDCEPLMVSTELDLGIAVEVEQPAEVGADRLVNAVAAHSRHPGPLIVIDFGTATTFDVVAADGAYRGGVIAPGVNLSLDALHMASARLPRVAAKRPPKVIGTSTIKAMQSGVYWGYVSLIEGVVARIEAEFGTTMTVLATGGLAPLFDKATEVIRHVEPDLTMRGLLEIYRRNRKDRK